jgi:hypothetical protein
LTACFVCDNNDYVYWPVCGAEKEMPRSKSNCLCAGTNFSWFAWIWASMVVLECDSMDCVLHGESSQAGRIKTTRSGLGDIVKEAIACKTALRISSCSYFWVGNARSCESVTE